MQRSRGPEGAWRRHLCVRAAACSGKGASLYRGTCCSLERLSVRIPPGFLAPTPSIRVLKAWFQGLPSGCGGCAGEVWTCEGSRRAAPCPVRGWQPRCGSVPRSPARRAARQGTSEVAGRHGDRALWMCGLLRQTTGSQARIVQTALRSAWVWMLRGGRLPRLWPGLALPAFSSLHLLSWLDSAHSPSIATTSPHRPPTGSDAQWHKPECLSVAWPPGSWLSAPARELAECMTRADQAWHLCWCAQAERSRWRPLSSCPRQVPAGPQGRSERLQEE